MNRPKIMCQLGDTRWTLRVRVRVFDAIDQTWISLYGVVFNRHGRWLQLSIRGWQSCCRLMITFAGRLLPLRGFHMDRWILPVQCRQALGQMSSARQGDDGIRWRMIEIIGNVDRILWHWLVDDEQELSTIEDQLKRSTVETVFKRVHVGVGNGKTPTRTHTPPSRRRRMERGTKAEWSRFPSTISFYFSPNNHWQRKIFHEVSLTNERCRNVESFHSMEIEMCRDRCWNRLWVFGWICVQCEASTNEVNKCSSSREIVPHNHHGHIPSRDVWAWGNRSIGDEHCLSFWWMLIRYSQVFEKRHVCERWPETRHLRRDVRHPSSKISLSERDHRGKELSRSRKYSKSYGSEYIWHLPLFLTVSVCTNETTFW